MKTTFFTVPIVLGALTIVAVWGLGLLAVKASAISTETSLELLRLHLRVAQLHDQLRLHSEASLAAEGAGLPPSPGLAPSGAKEGELRPWPAPPAPSALENGLSRARPVLKRLAGQFDRALGTR